MRCTCLLPKQISVRTLQITASRFSFPVIYGPRILKVTGIFVLHMGVLKPGLRPPALKPISLWFGIIVLCALPVLIITKCLPT